MRYIPRLGASAGLLIASLCSISAHAQDGGTVQDYFQQHWGISLDNVYWGDVHSHSYYSGDTVLQASQPENAQISTPETLYATMKERGFKFGAVTDHAEAARMEQITDGSRNVWQSQLKMAKAASNENAEDPGFFVPFPGFEYTNPFPCWDLTGVGDDGVRQCPGDCGRGDETCEAHGHKNVVFRSVDGAPPMRASFLDPDSWTTPPRECVTSTGNYCGFKTYTVYARDNRSLWGWLRALHYDGDGQRPISALTIIHTPGNAQHTDWSVIDSSFVRHVEIFSKWGNSEGPPPQLCQNQNDIDVSLPGEAENDASLLVRSQIDGHWLKLGDERYALGFTAGSDDHGGHPGGIGNGIGGVVGVVTTNLSRNGLFDAMVARHTMANTYYASTGPLSVLMAIETGEQNLLAGDIGDIAVNGKSTLRVWASDPVEQIQVVVDGCTVLTLDGSVQQVQLPELSPTRRHYVYVRARRQTTAGDANGDANPPATAWNQTWSSPVYLRPSAVPPMLQRP
jgi:hypothetical protein